MGFNPLVVVLSPRNLKEVREAIDTLPYDRLWIKHFPATMAYPIMEKQFEEHTEYTHLIINPDDLVTPWESLRVLVEDVLTLPDNLKDNCIVAGYCNIDKKTLAALSNVSLFTLPRFKREPGTARTYEEYHFLSLAAIPILDKMYLTDFNPYLFQTRFNGLTAWIIPRAVKEKFIFKNDSASGYGEDGCCWDVMTCYTLDKLKIPIFTDQRVQLEHLRSTPESSRTFHLDEGHRAIIWEYPADSGKEKVIIPASCMDSATNKILVGKADSARVVHDF